MDLKKLQQFGILKNYKRGNILYRIGDQDKSMYIILKGSVSIQYDIADGNKTEVLEAGNFFAEASVILDIPKMQTCVIEEDGTVLLSIPQSKFECAIQEDSGFSLRIMRMLSKELLESLSENARLVKELAQYASQEIQELGDIKIPIAKSRDEPEQGEIKTQEADIKKAKTGKVNILEEPMLESLKTLQKLNIIPSDHKMYRSRQWPDSLKAISPKSIECPICEKSFVSTYLSRSRMGVAKTRPDMRRVYQDIEPIYFEQYTCHRCGYSNFSGEFNKIKPGDKEALGMILSLITDLPFDLNENIFDINYVFLKLYLSVFCAEKIDKSGVILAKLWMRLSWLYEDEEEYEMRELMLQKAYDAYFNVYYHTKTFTEEAEKEVLLLMGELSLELGNERDALNHFMEVLQSKTVNNLQRRTAEDRVYEIRQRNKERQAKAQAEAQAAAAGAE